jgi:sulfate transport system permease protein
MTALNLNRRHILPGFGLSLGYTTMYLSVIVLIPIAVLFLRAASQSWSKFAATLMEPRVISAFGLTIGASIIAATVNAVFGSLVAWVLVRYEFPGRRIVDAMIDLPFALPTAVAGIVLTTLYSPGGWIGRWLAAIGVDVAFTRVGVVIALTFIGLPFVVRTIQPVIADLDPQMEEAAASLGARRSQVIRRVILPELLPALLTGFSLAFARAIGEYGSVVFISGNMPNKTEIVPLLIVIKLEQFDYAGATSLAVVMIVVSFLLLLVVNLLQRWTARGQQALLP